MLDTTTRTAMPQQDSLKSNAQPAPEAAAPFDQSDAKPAKNTNLKQSYTISCSSDFRDRVGNLADKRKVNVADLARSILLSLPAETIHSYDDPGDPKAEDREVVVLKSGPSKGRPWRRKPRLQVRMAPGYDPLMIRKALNIALHMDEGKAVVRIDTAETAQQHQAELEAVRKQAEAAAKVAFEQKNTLSAETREEMERLKAMVSVLSFEPLRDGVQDRSDALYVLGFPAKSYPTKMEIIGRFRMMATIHHPDGQYGSHERMSQLNQAMSLLRSS